ncbi:hypothetical protein I314_03147 [Cryptococcus bacillisporus CA1873]|uniref:Uncharacterized protein n=1 Tax=Cryptococcus bacillisporus CA1873 TaxID=1296111 RepID=A0ABR5BBQ8_CRYGA|nr:hypothetical protein I314_03147 [Cryptococcus bacillisporus CA1873]|eukprot:KIR63741.1 hypothetical protein I314_03147 [Cryptococcus gattii CA1873]
MPQRASYSWYPPKSALSLSPSYLRPPSGTSDFDNEDRPFQYSTAGPPTVYSELETAWSQPSHMRPRTAGSPAPPLPVPGRSKNEVTSPKSPLDGIEDDGDDNEDDVDDLYHRRDWEEGPKTSATGWSRSSWAGPTTGGTHLTHFSKLGGIMEDEEEWILPVPARTPNQLMPQRVSAPPERVRYRGVEYAVDQREVMDSPGEMTPAAYRDRDRNSMSSMIGARMDNNDEAPRNLSMLKDNSLCLPSLIWTISSKNQQPRRRSRMNNTSSNHTKPNLTSSLKTRLQIVQLTTHHKTIKDLFVIDRPMPRRLHLT